MQIISLKYHSNLLNNAATWFSSKFHIPVEAYVESILACQTGNNIIPQWYVMLNEEDEIIGGLGVIENDFHKRPDLTPNVCAVFVDEAYRGQGIARQLLDFVCTDMKNQGIANLYLLTSHTEFYEKCGWTFYGMIEENSGEFARCYKKELINYTNHYSQIP